MLNDAMKALTARKPIALTTTSLCSGAFTARIAREQRLRALRIAGVATGGWEGFERDVDAGHYKTNGLEILSVTLPDGAAAAAALVDGTADIAFTDTATAIVACAGMRELRFIALAGETAFAYTALAPVIAAKHYAISRLVRALRENAGATYVDARELQTLIDRAALEKRIGATYDAHNGISDIAVISGTR